MNAYEKLAAADRRRNPDSALIATIRERYPVEPEIDRVLTRKMMNRGGPRYTPVPIDTLVAGTKALIDEALGYPVTITDAAWLSGGASKLQMTFTLHWRGMDAAGDEALATPLVLRMEPAASVTESSRRREFQVLQAVAGTVPVPPTYWIDADASFLPYPAIVYGFARGVAKPSQDADKVSGLGQNYGPALRAKLAPQFVDMLARIHNIDVDGIDGLDAFERPVVGSNASVIRQVNAYRRIWEEDRLEAIPFMDVVYKWLVRHAPPLDHVSIVHGDYRSGNFLFDETSGEITAWLDWEGAVLGDRHQDLTYATQYTFQHVAEDGRTPLASGMLPAEALYAAYAKVSGRVVDPVRLDYYGVFNRFLIAVLGLAAAPRAAACAKSHQDVLLNYVAGIGYPSIENLRTYFAEVIA